MDSVKNGRPRPSAGPSASGTGGISITISCIYSSIGLQQRKVCGGVIFEHRFT